MELIKDKPLLLITPTAILRDRLVEQTIKEKGTFSLNDSIAEELAFDAEASTFPFIGVYPNLFKDDNEAKLFKDCLEELIGRTNSRSHLKVKHIDDILFITYFYTGYTGEVYANNQNIKHLDDLIDVFIDLLDSKHTPTDSDHIWIEDNFTGIESEVSKHLYTEEELKMNGGFKVLSRMVPPNNVIYHFASDRPITIDKRVSDKNLIRLPERLSKKLLETTVSYIIDEHKKADTLFFKELRTGYLDTRSWRERTRARGYDRLNKALCKLIIELDHYIYDNNKSSLITDRREVIYDVLALLKMLPFPLKINRSDKALAIRTIVKDNTI
jgi:hypothetical protein